MCDCTAPEVAKFISSRQIIMIHPQICLWEETICVLKIVRSMAISRLMTR